MEAVFCPFAVVPVLLGPLQILLLILPGLLLALLMSIISLLKPTAMLNLLRILWRQKLQVAILVAAGAGIYKGWHWLGQKFGPVAGAAEESGQQWPTARGNLYRCGSFDGIGPTQGGIRWTWKRKGEAFYSSPAVVGNRVYVASASLGLFGQSGTIYCFDADTGAERPQGLSSHLLFASGFGQLSGLWRGAAHYQRCSHHLPRPSPARGGRLDFYHRQSRGVYAGGPRGPGVCQRGR
jgi:hypothetical protein